MHIVRHRFMFLATIFFAAVGVLLATPDDTFAAAKQSTVALSLQSEGLSLDLTATPLGNFGESSSTTISVTTDNFTGYSLSINAIEGESSLQQQIGTQTYPIYHNLRWH